MPRARLASLGLPPANPVEAARLIAPEIAAEAPEVDGDGAFPHRSIDLLRRSGLLAAPMPAAHGGCLHATDAVSARWLADTLRTIGAASLPVGRLYEGHVNALQLIARYGATAQIDRCSADVEQGHLFGVWNTEAPGSALRLIDGRLTGGKTYASGAGRVTRPLVTARRPDGEVVMLVARLAQGERSDLTGWLAHGMRASATGRVDLSGLAVGDDDIVGRPGDYLRQPFFSTGAWRFAAVQQGGASRLVQELCAHLTGLGRTGDPHQLARVGDAALAAETARLWIGAAAARAASADADPRGAVAYVNLCRHAVERAGLDILELVHRSVGLQGFLRTHPIERLSRDLATYLRQPAPDRALTDAAAYAMSSPVFEG